MPSQAPLSEAAATKIQSVHRGRLVRKGAQERGPVKDKVSMHHAVTIRTKKDYRTECFLCIYIISCHALHDQMFPDFDFSCNFIFSG